VDTITWHKCKYYPQEPRQLLYEPWICSVVFLNFWIYSSFCPFSSNFFVFRSTQEKKFLLLWVFVILSVLSTTCLSYSLYSDEHLKYLMYVFYIYILFRWSDLGSATLSAQKLRWADYLNILNDQVFFPPWRHRYSQWWHCQNTSGSNSEKVVQGAWNIFITHGLATRVHTLTTLGIFGMC